MENQHSKIKNPSAPIAWTIAGSDSGAGAGIQADLKTMNAFGVHGCSIITALTAQNTREVLSSEITSPSLLREQFHMLKTDLPPLAIKTGMLGNTTNCEILAELLGSMSVPIICDPVLSSTSGSDLLSVDALAILKQDIFPHVAVLTPNLPEAAILTGKPVTDIEQTAEAILSLGVGSVLIKGGHAQEQESCDYWTDGTKSRWLSSPRVDTRATHGTGCILSSAIASAVALGQEIGEAIVLAKTLLNQCLATPARVGSGHGPMMIEPFRNDEKDRPTIQQSTL